MHWPCIVKELWGLQVFVWIIGCSNPMSGSAKYNWRLVLLEGWNNKYKPIILFYMHACHWHRQGHMERTHVNRTIYIIATQEIIKIDIFIKDHSSPLSEELLQLGSFRYATVDFSSKETSGSSSDSESASLLLWCHQAMIFLSLYSSLYKAENQWSSSPPPFERLHFGEHHSDHRLVIHIFEALMECGRYNPVSMDPKLSEQEVVRCVSINDVACHF